MEVSASGSIGLYTDLICLFDKVLFPKISVFYNLFVFYFVVILMSIIHLHVFHTVYCCCIINIIKFCKGASLMLHVWIFKSSIFEQLYVQCLYSVIIQIDKKERKKKTCRDDHYVPDANKVEYFLYCYYSSFQWEVAYRSTWEIGSYILVVLLLYPYMMWICSVKQNLFRKFIVDINWRF